VRRLGVISSAAVIAAIAAALAVAAPGDDPVELAVVGIEARIGGDSVISSGVVIDADAGLVLTSAHTVWGATELRLATHVGLLHGRIVARAPCTDLALLETQPRIPGLTSLSGSSAAVEYPLNVAARALDGRLVHIHRPLPEWASGAPVLDADGHITGIAEAAQGRRSTIVPWTLIRERLDKLRPDERRIFVGWRDEYACAAQLHAATRARHPGFRRIDAVLNAPIPATRLPGTEELDR
jgi:hypothetical protein